MSFYKIRPRSGTKAQWETANTILAEREIGYELPDGGVGTGVVKMKMGDGVTAWNDLPYAIPIYLSPDDIVQDATTDSSVKVPSASVTKNLQDQVTALNNSLGNCIKHKFITPQTQTVTDEALKTATRISITLYYTGGARSTKEVRCDQTTDYNLMVNYINGVKYIDTWSYDRNTGTLTRTRNSGLNFELVSVDYI